MSGEERARVVVALARHQRARTDIRWDEYDHRWVHWHRCWCGHEERSDRASALWWEEHATDVIIVALAPTPVAGREDAASSAGGAST